MICKSCSKNVETPLVLYDGRLACPYCTRELTDVGDFRVNAESEADYRIAELGFLRWLERPSAETKKYLDRSVEACIRAARSGHPKAVVRLGYLYEKGYVDGTHGRSESSTVAYGYYKKVCFAGNVRVKVSDGVAGYGEAEFAEIRKGAAMQLLSLIASFPKNDGGVSLRSRANMEEVRRRVIAAYPSLSGFGESLMPTAEPDRASRILSVLTTTAASGRTPLFGVIRISNPVLRGLFSTENERTAYKLISGGLELWYAPCDGDGVVSESSEQRFQALSNRKLVCEVLDALENGGAGYLYFFNGANRRRQLKKSVCEHVRKDLQADEFMLVKRIANKGGQSEYTFYDDDIIKNKSRLSFDRAAETLVEDVVKNANESF